MMLDDLGLHAALEWLARDAARRLGIEVTLQLDEHEPVLDDRVATAAFRMVQEALTNVAPHTRASDVQIGLHRAGGALQISVRDNGVGYPDDALRREGSMGLIGMRERAALLGGHAELSNRRAAAQRCLCAAVARARGQGEPRMNDTPLRVLIVDDHAVVREGSRASSAPASAGRWAKRAAAASALDWLRQQRADVAIVDLSMPGMSGLELVKRIRAEFGACRCWC